MGGGSSISSSSGATVENNISLANGDGTFNQSGSAIYSGVISGSGNLIKSGTGTVTLSGSNSYTGDTTINAGVLTLSGTLSDSTDVIVNSGATYDVNANDTIQSLTGAGTIDIASSRTLTAGGDNGSENISEISQEVEILPNKEQAPILFKEEVIVYPDSLPLLQEK